MTGPSGRYANPGNDVARIVSVRNRFVKSARPGPGALHIRAGHIRAGHRVSLAGGTLLLAAGATLLAACGGGTSSHSSTATQPPATQPPATQPPATQPSTASPSTMAPAQAAASTSGPIVITTSTTRFGQILADAKGMALYTATGDTPSHSGCSGACLKFWPPLLLPAGQTQAKAGPGVTGLGTFMRPEGTQVTYHGKPLYTWIEDTRPGQVTGQGVVDSGGTWFVATVSAATGHPAAATPSTPATPSGPAATTPPTTAPAGGVSY
jgi:predicted lipoprotein with Yx(FWY)xxD motif